MILAFFNHSSVPSLWTISLVLFTHPFVLPCTSRSSSFMLHPGSFSSPPNTGQHHYSPPPAGGKEAASAWVSFPFGHLLPPIPPTGTILARIIIVPEWVPCSRLLNDLISTRAAAAAIGLHWTNDGRTSTYSPWGRGERTSHRENALCVRTEGRGRRKTKQTPFQMTIPNFMQQNGWLTLFCCCMSEQTHLLCLYIDKTNCSGVNKSFLLRFTRSLWFDKTAKGENFAPNLIVEQE